MLHVFQWKNGDKEWSPFSAAEMDRRQNAMRAHLAPRTSMPRFHLLPRHLLLFRFPLLLFRPQVRLRADAGCNATTVSAGIDGGQPWRRSHGDNIIYSDWRRDNFFTALKSLIPAGARRVGIEFDHVSLDFASCSATRFPASSSSMWPKPRCGCAR
jgi:creatinase